MKPGHVLRRTLVHAQIDYRRRSCVSTGRVSCLMRIGTRSALKGQAALSSSVLESSPHYFQLRLTTRWPDGI